MVIIVQVREGHAQLGADRRAGQPATAGGPAGAGARPGQVRVRMRAASLNDRDLLEADEPPRPGLVPLPDGLVR